MKRYMLSVIRPLLPVVFGVWLYGCFGGGTEIPEGIMVGTLYTDQGVAVGASVIIGKVGDVLDTSASPPSVPIKVETGRDGSIIIGDEDKIDNGYYSVCGESQTGTLKSYSDSVLFINGKCSLISDTLRNVGSVTGKIQLLNGDDPRKTLIWISGVWGSGSSSPLLSDAAGNFTLKNFAQGNYRVVFIPTNDQYNVLDTIIPIRSGISDTLSKPLILPFVMGVSGFTCVVDTLMGSATFSWNKLDNRMISGYQFAYDEGRSSWLPQVILGDTTFKTVYLKDSLTARVCALVNDQPTGQFSPSLKVQAVDLVNIRTLFTPDDTVYSKAWTLNGDRIFILQASQFNQKEIHIDEYDTSGSLLKVHRLDSSVNAPLALSSYLDTLYLLDKKSDDVLCLRKLTAKDSVFCNMNVSVPNNLGIGSSLKFGKDGTIFISQYLTIYAISPSGDLIARKNAVSPHFAISDKCIYTFSNGQNSKIVEYDYSLSSTDAFHYDKYNYYSDNDILSKFAAANNNGIFCCLFDVSLFVVNKDKTFNARLYIREGGSVIDLWLTDSNMLYLLYVNGRVDVVNIGDLVSGKK